MLWAGGMASSCGMAPTVFGLPCLPNPLAPAHTTLGDGMGWDSVHHQY